jgi:hypothetical protein
MKENRGIDERTGNEDRQVGERRVARKKQRRREKKRGGRKKQTE